MIPPRDATAGATGTIAEIVGDVLGFDVVTADDDLFMLGMTSLSAIQILARVNEVFDIDLDVVAAFDALTVRQLADLAEASRTSARSAAGDG